MSTAPHPALRGLWNEAAAADRANREICVLQHAWDWAIDSTLDLPLLDSDELVRPLIEFGAFEPPIAEALDRIRGEREPTENPDHTAIHQLPSAQDADARREAGWSLPPKREAAPTRMAASDSPPASHQTATETFSTTARLAAVRRSDVAERSRRSEPVSPAEIRAVFDHTVREDIRDVGPAIRKRVLNEHSPLIPAKPTITGEALANGTSSPELLSSFTNSAPRSVDRVPLSSVDATASGSSVVSIPDGEKPDQASLSANGLSVAGEKKIDRHRARHGNLFEQILGAAVERYTRAARQRQIRAEQVSREAASGEPEFALQRDPNQPSPAFPRTGLQRLAARALQRAGSLSEASRPSHELEFASFAAATCVSGIESAEFAAHLNTLLRREMARHGITAEDFQ